MQSGTHLFTVSQCLASAGFCSCSHAWSHGCAWPLSSVVFSPPGREGDLTLCIWLLTWWLGALVVRFYRYKILWLAVSFMSVRHYYQNIQSWNSIIRCFLSICVYLRTESFQRETKCWIPLLTFRLDLKFMWLFDRLFLLSGLIGMVNIYLNGIMSAYVVFKLFFKLVF